MTDYNYIFTNHINRILAEKNITKQELAAIAGVSAAFITALTRGEGNPTLKTMQAMAEGLGIPLPLLLKPLESDEWQTILSLSTHKQAPAASLPAGYSLIEKAVLPAHKVFVVEQWIKEAKKKLQKKS